MHAKLEAGRCKCLVLLLSPAHVLAGQVCTAQRGWTGPEDHPHLCGAHSPHCQRCGVPAVL